MLILHGIGGQQQQRWVWGGGVRALGSTALGCNLGF
jgi:hypothetical protein